MCPNYIKGIFCSNVIALLFLDTLAVIFRKKSEIAREIFCPEISRNRCTNQYKHSLAKIETPCIVVLSNGTDCRFVDYKYYCKCGNYIFSCPGGGNSLSVTQKVHNHVSILKVNIK